MGENIVIVDLGMGNLNSVKKKLYRLGIDSVITSEQKIISSADKIILPGVGHFSQAMENMRRLNLFDTLNEFALVHKKPVLGICLGMQLLAKHSEEGDSHGLGWIDANVVRFKISDKLKFKIPHTGWNSIIKTKNSLLMKGIDDESFFYFVHSFHFLAENREDILNETDYEYRFPSAMEKNNIFGVQYHPEKSHDVGEKLLKNFIEL